MNDSRRPITGRQNPLTGRHTAPRDLIGDIHAQQRRKLFRRVALIVVLILALLAVGLALKVFADRRSRDACLDDARDGFARGTSAELDTVAERLDTCIEDHGDDPQLLGARALTRAQLLAEFGVGDEAAHAAVAALDATTSTHDGELARVMIALDDGELGQARADLEAAAAMRDRLSIGPNHEEWIAGMLAIADPEANLDEAIDAVSKTVEEDPSISLRRLLATLHMHAGDGDAALEELGRAREQDRTHLGLAADEALYNALLRQKLPGVADVADQLLGDEFATKLAPRDRAHTLLARGVVQIQDGEVEAGMQAVSQAWDELPGWDKLSRTLALEMAMEAGDGERARQWISEAGLRAPESEIYEAWVKLVEGDVMAALAELAKLPQEHPRVALLQGLALVEQGRWVEAKPWLERAEKFLPKRIDVEVARARVDAQIGDAEAARRKLEALAEEEPFAPRAWTGLGEAHLAVAYYEVEGEGVRKPRPEPDPDALKEARRAFKWAVQRERQPAEAYLQLAEITDRKRGDDPKLVDEVVDLLTKAVEANDNLPRYAERHALYLAEVGRHADAKRMLAKVNERPGVSFRVPLMLAGLALDEVEFDKVVSLDEGFEGWVEDAESRRAPGRDLDIIRARALLLTPDEPAKAKADKSAEARDKLAKIVAAAPTDLEAWTYLTRAHMELKDRDAALGAVRQGIEAVGKEDAGRLFLEQAKILFRGGKKRVAATQAGKGWNFLRDRPEGVSTLVLAWAAEETVKLFQRDGRAKPALTVAKQLTRVAPTHSDAWVLRASVELRNNRGSDAKASAEKAVELDPNNPKAHELLGQLYLRFGRKSSAREAFEKAVELGKDTPQAEDYKKSLASLGDEPE